MKRSQWRRCIISRPDRVWKHDKTTPSAGKVKASLYLDLSGRLIHRVSDRTTNHQHTLLFEVSQGPRNVSLSFKTTKSINRKHLSLPRQPASAYLRCENGNVGKNEMRGTAMPHLQSWPSAKRVLPLRSTQNGPRKIRFRAVSEVELFVQQWVEEQQ
jgi:hypothetical protein